MPEIKDDLTTRFILSKDDFEAFKRQIEEPLSPDKAEILRKSLARGRRIIAGLDDSIEWARESDG